ncbi:MAG: hypothetical protein GY799_16690 [Desulfobulbaceae bacterium]|nr:hypothetical protein [Desulfobulbaceae bacterium]
MKKSMVYTMTLLLASTLSFVGTSNAGWFGSGDKAKEKSEVVSPAVSDQAEPATEEVIAAAEQAMPAGEQLILSGTIDENSQFVDEQGEIFTLANNDKGLEVKSMSGMKVEIKGTVMEKEGQKTVEVIDYNILK